MKILRGTFKVVLLSLVVLTLSFSALQWVALLQLPSELVLIKGTSCKMDFINPVFSKVDIVNNSIVEVKGSSTPERINSNTELRGVVEGQGYINVKAFGAFSIRKINLEVVSNKTIYPSGKLIGLKLETDGLLVIQGDSVKTAQGEVSPAKKAGIKQGDFIIGTKNKVFKKVEDFIEEINNSNGKYINIIIRRGEEIITVKLTPVMSLVDNKYRVGLWLRDGIAGLGTITFVEKNQNVYGALGHSVLDVDTGIQLPIRDGKLYDADLLNIRKGTEGQAGEVQGVILEDKLLGNVVMNYYQGIYGKVMDGAIDSLDLKPYKVASRYEIKPGSAIIISDVEKDVPKFYKCNIIKVNTGSTLGVKGFIVQVTDPELLKITGGIIQGMSGSPVIQNGKIIGAITHVMVNDPKKGYGVFIDSMLKTASMIAN